MLSRSTQALLYIEQCLCATAQNDAHRMLYEKRYSLLEVAGRSPGASISFNTGRDKVRAGARQGENTQAVVASVQKKVMQIL